MVVLAEPARGRTSSHGYRRRWLFVAVLLAGDALFLGSLGWILPTPGESLIAPTLIVFAIGCVVAIASWIVDRGRVMAIGVFGIAVIASLWTFALSLPASLAWNSGATHQAQAALRGPGPTKVSPADESYLPCSVIRSGAVGPLGAPYQVCVTSFNKVRIVRFVTLTRPSRGVAYTDVGASSFPDECARHLIGMWWMFVEDTSGIGNCPIGYQFEEGP